MFDKINSEDKKREYQVENKNKTEEDSTKYGEFIPSQFEWVTLDVQKKKAQELEEMTKKQKHK